MGQDTPNFFAPQFTLTSSVGYFLGQFVVIDLTVKMTSTSTTNEMLLEFMKSFKAEVNTGNANMVEKINMKIENIDKKLDNRIGKLSEKIDVIDDNLSRLKTVTEENKNEAREMDVRMTRRIEALEKEMDNSLEIRRRTLDLRKKEQNLVFQPTGSAAQSTQKSCDLNYSSNWAK